MRLARPAALLVVLLVLAAAPATSPSHPVDLTDTDHDGIRNYADNCPVHFNPSQADADADTPPPLFEHDGHPATGPARVYPFTDGYGISTDRPADKGGDSCDVDDDGDGVTDRPRRDNCRLVANPGQEDADGDGMGDACDVDSAGTDTSAPRVRVGVARRQPAEALGRGIAVRVRSSEACAIEAAARHRGQVVGRGAARLEGRGLTFAFVRLDRSWLRRARRARHAQRLSLTLRARDRAGNATTTRRLLRVTT